MVRRRGGRRWRLRWVSCPHPKIGRKKGKARSTRSFTPFLPPRTPTHVQQGLASAAAGGTVAGDAGQGRGEEVWPLVEDRYCYEALARLLEGTRPPSEWAVRSHMALLQVLALQAAVDAWGPEAHPQVGRGRWESDGACSLACLM